MWYLINSWKLLSKNPPVPPEKIHSPLLTHFLLKIQKSASPRLLANTENFSGSPLQKGGGGAHRDLEEPSQTSKEELLSKIVNGL